MEKDKIEKAKKEFARLIEIMEKLRSEEGCPWDRKQTHQSLKPYVIEEAYELVHAIEKNDINGLKEELGDLLLQVIFHSQIAYENNEFDIGEVIEILNNKLINRHPHVFEKKGEYSYEQWEKLKAKEKNEEHISRIGKLKFNMPPLYILRRLLENSLKELNFDPYYGENILDHIKKLLCQKEYLEEKTLEKLLFLIIYLSVKENINLDKILMNSINNFYNNFLKLEKWLDKEFDKADVERKKRIWEKIEYEESKKML